MLDQVLGLFEIKPDYCENICAALAYIAESNPDVEILYLMRRL